LPSLIFVTCAEFALRSSPTKLLITRTYQPSSLCRRLNLIFKSLIQICIYLQHAAAYTFRFILQLLFCLELRLLTIKQSFLYSVIPHLPQILDRFSRLRQPTRQHFCLYSEICSSPHCCRFLSGCTVTAET
jgi:hypothetical protein